MDAQGGYSKEPIKVVTTIARQHESATIFRLVNAIDPNAFVSQSQYVVSSDKDLNLSKKKHNPFLSFRTFKTLKTSK
jgi:hypothetical protein